MVNVTKHTLQDLADLISLLFHQHIYKYLGKACVLGTPVQELTYFFLEVDTLILCLLLLQRRIMD